MYLQSGEVHVKEKDIMDVHVLYVDRILPFKICTMLQILLNYNCKQASLWARTVIRIHIRNHPSLTADGLDKQHGEWADGLCVWECWGPLRTPTAARLYQGFQMLLPQTALIQTLQSEALTVCWPLRMRVGERGAIQVIYI